MTAIDTEIKRTRFVNRDDLATKHFADLVDHVETDVLFAVFDAIDGALAGVEFGGEFGLGEASFDASFLDDFADLGFAIDIVIHVIIISWMR